MRDDDIRSSCFAALDVLCARYGDEVPYPDGLDSGFAFRGRRVPFMSRYSGIYRAAVQRGPAALSVQTSARSPYDDSESTSGYLYDYRAAPLEHHDNRALRAAHTLQVPLIHFVATRTNYYKPVYPCFVVADDPHERRVVISPGKMIGPLDEREPVMVDSPVEREYLFRETRVRVHQARFRAQVIPAYKQRCAICRLKEGRLLDAAHIVGDLEERGEPIISNGLSLCSIHHRAFDHDLVGITPDYEVRVASRLLDDEDGPMLELLKAFHQAPIVVPARTAWQPDRERLATRFDRFLAAE